MITFANKNGNLTVILGTVVYEIPTVSLDQAWTFSRRAQEDAVVAALIQVACNASVRVGNKHELADRNDPRLRVDNSDKVKLNPHKR